MSDHWHRPRARTFRSRLTITLVAGALSTLVAAGALAQMPKSALIGKLEGPEVVTDPAKFPKTFNEAPQLAALVKAGKLPPVAERIGQDPLVLRPLHEIGKYGGTWRRGFTGPADFWNGYRCCAQRQLWNYARFARKRVHCRLDEQSHSRSLRGRAWSHSGDLRRGLYECGHL